MKTLRIISAIALLVVGGSWQTIESTLFMYQLANGNTERATSFAYKAELINGKYRLIDAILYKVPDTYSDDFFREITSGRLDYLIIKEYTTKNTLLHTYILTDVSILKMTNQAQCPDYETAEAISLDAAQFTIDGQ